MRRDRPPADRIPEWHPWKIRVAPDAPRVIQRLWQEMQLHQIGPAGIAQRHGALVAKTVSDWLRDRHAASLSDLGDVYALFDMELYVRRVDPPLLPFRRQRRTVLPRCMLPAVRDFLTELYALGLDARSVARAAGLGSSTVHSWKRQSPKLWSFERACTVLGLVLDVRYVRDDISRTAVSPRPRNTAAPECPARRSAGDQAAGHRR